MGALSGRRVVVTRPRDRAGPLVAALEAEGAEVILAPMIEIVPPEDPGPLREAAARLGEYDWVVFTSVYAVRALAEAVGEGSDPGAEEGGEASSSGPLERRPPGVACVGPATAEAARAVGWEPDLVPEDVGGVALAEALIAAGAGPQTRVLFPRAADAREELPRRLRACDVQLHEVVAYGKTAVPEAGTSLRKSLADGRIDALTFTAPSTVRNFVGHFGSAPRLPTVVIGTATGAAATAAGFERVVVAGERSTDGLVRAVVNIFNR